MLSAGWVFGWNSHKLGVATRAKVRLVASGCGQHEGMDLFETFGATSTAPCIRLLGAIACELDCDLLPFT